MQKISIEEFATKTVERNKDLNREKLIQSLQSALAAKKQGAKCVVCGAPIWAAGSALAGTNMCFSCITGSADDSDDYEIEHENK